MLFVLRTHGGPEIHGDGLAQCENRHCRFYKVARPLDEFKPNKANHIIFALPEGIYLLDKETLKPFLTKFGIFSDKPVEPDERGTIQGLEIHFDRHVPPGEAWIVAGDRRTIIDNIRPNVRGNQGGSRP